MSKETVFSSIDELARQHHQVHHLTGWEFVTIQQEHLFGVLHRLEPLGDGSVAPRVLVANRHQLVEMAKAILRQLDPSPEQEILATLHRIEARLQETEQQ